MPVLKYVEDALAAASSRDGQPVSEYLIAPPREPIYKSFAALAGLRRHMSERFPNLSFDIRSDFPFGHPLEFVALPVMGVSAPNEPDRFLMCQAPTIDETQAIYAALEEFDPLAKPTLMH